MVTNLTYLGEKVARLVRSWPW